MLGDHIGTVVDCNIHLVAELLGTRRNLEHRIKEAKENLQESKKEVEVEKKRNLEMRYQYNKEIEIQAHRMFEVERLVDQIGKAKEKVKDGNVG